MAQISVIDSTEGTT